MVWACIKQEKLSARDLLQMCVRGHTRVTQVEEYIEQVCSKVKGIMNRKTGGKGWSELWVCIGDQETVTAILEDSLSSKHVSLR